ncbi:hypothetical protein jhhlp_006621 [Lomentospora prolificans]|uniref:Uncharacterized protein n=1 Tax=Lomentospora prolificans TaxID=41688 RepID=A0A2N3N6E2_9PEZI|nr:hypothetical protein jhhlp_006621 [Lomentospora prolificans]
MPATTYPEFSIDTEGLEVTKAFADQVRGKTVIVTGVNRAGIGFTTAHALASQGPAHLIAAGRNLSKLQESIDAIKAEFPNVDYRALKVDLSSQASVRSAAAEVLSWDDIPAINILINSAGIMCVPERTLSEDGIELHFATNHIGHWLLTCLLMPKLIKASQDSPKGATRIVNVTSASSWVSTMRWSDINFEKPNKELPQVEQPPYDFMKMWGYTDVEDKAYIPLDGYNRSKVANVLNSIGTTNRLYESHGILSLAVHPGIILTELARDFPKETMDAVGNLSGEDWFHYKTQGAGSSTTLVAALDPKLGPGETRNGKENYGVFLADCQISDACLPLSVSSDEADKLWKLSEDLVKEQFAW